MIKGNNWYRMINIVKKRDDIRNKKYIREDYVTVDLFIIRRDKILLKRTRKSENKQSE